MSADLLRRAAADLRAKVDAARAGEWFADGPEVRAVWCFGARDVAVCAGSLPEGNAANAALIAMGPDVALALAEVLAFAAEQWSDERCHWPVGPDETCGECADCERYWLQVRLSAVTHRLLGSDQ